MIYREYLERKRYAAGTIHNAELFVKRLQEYLADENVLLSECGYTDILGFMGWLERSGKSKAHINRHLSSLTHYFDYLKKMGQVSSNPVKNLRIRNIPERLPHDILDRETLDGIYESYEVISLIGKRNKIMLGLLVYQGLLKNELLRLEQGDIDLKNGRVHIGRHSSADARVLKLEPFQILPLQEYITRLRSEIIRKRGRDNPYLFIGQGWGKTAEGALKEFTDNLKKAYPEIKNLMHIRTSVITHWVKEKSLREAQYLAGHYKITSTERYKHIDLRNLLATLKKYHPLQ